MTFFRLRFTLFFSILFILGFNFTMLAEETPESASGGYLGIKSESISSTKAKYLGFNNQYGAYINFVYPDSPAERGGLRIFDYIVEVDNKTLKKSHRFSDALAKFQPGDEVDIAYLRNGVFKETSIVLARRSDLVTPVRVSAAEDAFLGIKESSSYSYDRQKGVRVLIVDGSSANDMGLRNGDIIYSIDGYRMLDWDDISTLMDSKRAGENVQIVYYRGENKSKVKGVLKSSAEKTSNSIVGQNNAIKRRVVLGVMSSRMTAVKAENMGLDNPHGFYIKSITKGSTAEKYGFMPLDYIYGIDNYRVGANQSLGSLLAKYEPGDEADFHIIRKGKAIVTPVKMQGGTSLNFPAIVRNACETPFLGVKKAADKVSFGLDVLIVDNSPAAKLGLQDYDAITRINGHYIIDWGDLTVLHKIYAPGDKMEIEVFRDGRKKTFKSVFISKQEAKNCETCNCGEIFISDEIIIELGDVEAEIEEEIKQLKEELNNLEIDIDIDFDDNKTNGRNRVEKRNYRSVEIQNTLSEEDQSKFRSFFGKGDSSPVLDVKEFSLKPLNDNVFYGIHFKLSDKGYLNVKVATDNGRLIYDFESSDFEGVFEDRIDLAQKDDTYYFFIRHNGKEFVKKVVLK